MSGPKVGNGDSEVIELDVSGKSKEFAKKSGKLSKSLKLSKLGNSKGKNLAMSKKSSKSGNLPNFNAKDSRPNFLTPKARSAFNRLWLDFTKALILQQFDPECHIRIETKWSGYAIGGVLSQLASRTSPHGIVTKANMG